MSDVAPFFPVSSLSVPPAPTLIKVSVPLAGSMMLTDTFRTAGRSAMILDDRVPRPAAGPAWAASDREGDEAHAIGRK